MAGALQVTGGWSSLFATAFSQSRNAMILLDEARRVVDVNGACLRMLGETRAGVVGEPSSALVVGGPRWDDDEWSRMLAIGQFTGVVEMRRSDGTTVAVQWGACTELVTGRRLVLFVALSTSRWGRRFRRDISEEPDEALTRREREIVMLVALGGTAREIADELHISHDTVRTHVRNAMEKLHARSRAQLVAKALSAGLVLE